MKIFVSYASPDRARAVGVVKALRGLGHDVFIDQHLEAGTGYRAVLEDEIRRADRVVVLWTKNSIRSSWVREEAEAARVAGKLLPVRFRVPPPFGFRELHTPDLPLLANGAEVASTLGLGDAQHVPAPAAATVGEASPEEWHLTGRIGGRLLQWATGAR